MLFSKIPELNHVSRTRISIPSGLESDFRCILTTSISQAFELSDGFFTIIFAVSPKR